jgi:replication factor C small subunit
MYLEDLVGNQAIVQQLQYIARTGQAPSCLVFVGPPGVGKTTAARALARTYFRELAQREGTEENLFGPQTFFEVGTEDIRIDPAEFVESRLIPFMRSMTMFGGKSRGWVLLDDVQKLSPQTQQSLLRPLERYGKSKTVIFAVNSVRNLVPALRSRCEEGFFEFQPIEPKDVARRLRDISAQEGIALPNQVGEIDRIAKASKGDVRVALGLLAREWRAYQASRVG